MRCRWKGYLKAFHPAEGVASALRSMPNMLPAFAVSESATALYIAMRVTGTLSFKDVQLGTPPAVGAGQSPEPTAEEYPRARS